MHRSVKTILVLLSMLVVLAFVVFLVGQTAQVVGLADEVNPTFGTIVLWVLLSAYALLVAVPLILFLRMPRPIVPPKSLSGPEFEAYLQGLKTRLARNANTKSMPMSTQQDVERALELLNSKANELTRNSSSVIFLSTAISQSGRLDTLVVLAELTRLIWRIAHLYNQRPSLRDLALLYGNVAGTAFVAGSLDDIDISEQMGPLLGSVTGGLTGAIPGMQVAASVVVNSILSGAANAFLTLRVGIITRRYCGSLTVPGKKEVRRAASIEAAKLLAGIVKEGAAKISKLTYEATKSKLGGAVSGVTSRATQASSSVISKVGLGRKVEPDGEPTT